MKKLFLLSIFLMFAFSAAANYIKNFPVTLTQPNGTEVHCFVTGDEYYNWVHDENGFTLIRDSQTGIIVYAQLENDELVATSYRVESIDPVTLGLEPWLNISAEKRGQIRKDFIKSNPQKNGETLRDRSSGTLNNIVIYIRFSDENEFPAKANTYNDWFNKDAANYASMYGYFKAVSNEKLFTPTTFYPTASGNTILSYKDSYPRSYFQPYNASTNPNGYNDNNRAEREHQLLKRAIDAVRNQIPANLNLDFDSDGYVDNICFIVRGAPGAWSSLLWPHQWVLHTLDVQLNGKRVWIYNMHIEAHFDQIGASVLAHEMFHSLGAPDLYRYNDETIDPVGPWDLMNANTNPPQSTNAYMKFKYGQWLSNIPEITQPGTYTINNVWSATNNAYKIASPNSSTEYFVIEYRDKNVYWDSGLPGSGLIIYRVNTTVEWGNADGPPDEVYIFRPGGTNNNTNGNIEQAFFSSQSGRTAFNNSSNPPCFLSNNQSGGISISNISASGGATMSFEVSASGACAGPLSLSVNYVSGCDAQLSWTPPTGQSTIPPQITVEEMCNSVSSKEITLTSKHIGQSIQNLPERGDGTRDGWLSWCGNPYDGVGAGQAEFIVAARFTAADLASYSITQGSTVSKITFVPYNLSYVAGIALCIFQGGNSPTNSGQMVYQQPISQSLIEQQYNEITLNTPYTINVSQELWIGYYIQTYGGYPAVRDVGPRVPDKGDLLYINGSWTNLYAASNYTINANWNIGAYIVLGGEPPQPCKYNVYRDGTPVASNISETSYIDKGFSPYQNHTWSVKVVCAGGGESVPANFTKESCMVGIHENGKTEISIYPNPTTGQLRIENGELKIENVEIYDVFGRKILNSQFSILNSINISHLPAGIYILKIQTESGVVAQKVVKQ